MRFFNVFLLLAIFFIASCDQPKPEEAKIFDQKMTETIAIHDEVMPEMTKLTSLIQKLEAKKDSTNVETVQPVIRDLKQGHDMMMEWMKDFGDEFSKTEINEGIQLSNIDSLKARLDALSKSKTAAEKMRDKIVSSMEKAETLLNQ